MYAVFRPCSIVMPMPVSATNESAESSSARLMEVLSRAVVSPASPDEPIVTNGYHLTGGRPPRGGAQPAGAPGAAAPGGGVETAPPARGRGGRRGMGVGGPPPRLSDGLQRCWRNCSARGDAGVQRLELSGVEVDLAGEPATA